jgi:hypothetical protein
MTSVHLNVTTTTPQNALRCETFCWRQLYRAVIGFHLN